MAEIDARDLAFWERRKRELEIELQYAFLMVKTLSGGAIQAARTSATLYIDGGCSRNGQVGARMRAVVLEADGAVLYDREQSGGTNNIAELWALVEAARWLSAQKIPTARVLTDSRNTIAWARKEPST